MKASASGSLASGAGIAHDQGDSGSDVVGPPDGSQVVSDGYMGRRRFLKNAGLVSAGIFAGDAFGPAHAVIPYSGDTASSCSSTMVSSISPAAGYIPILTFNDPHNSHLLSIDLRSEQNLLDLNNRYGEGCYKPIGSLTFDAQKGVYANDATSGLQIDLSRLLPTFSQLGLASEGQFTIELESSLIADPWLLDEYLDRYSAVRRDKTQIPVSNGQSPFADQKGLCRLVSGTGVSGPVVDGPSPESPSGLGTRANNLNVKIQGGSLQAMQVGVHTCVHAEFCSITVAWWGGCHFAVYVDSVPYFLAGPNAVGPHGVEVSQYSYMVNDRVPDASPRKLIELFVGRQGVPIRRLVLGAKAPVFETHPLFREWASFGDSFTHRGGYANSKIAVKDLWDADHVYFFMRKLADYGYRPGWCWNNSLGGAGYLKTGRKTLWYNNEKSDLISLMRLSPSFVMMAASHNDAAYIGKGGSPFSPEYQRRLAQVKSDFLEHIQVILTGSSPGWSMGLVATDACIGVVSVPVSPRGSGWQGNEVQAQRDLNNFVVHDVLNWVQLNLGEVYRARIASFDVAAMCGGENLVNYHPLFELSGEGVHPNWWGAEQINYGWWQCALQLM